MRGFSGVTFRAGAAAGLLAVVGAALAGCGGSTPPPASGPSLRIHRNVVYGRSAEGHPLTEDVYSRTGETGPAPVVLMIHGGGFTSGDKRGVSQFAAGLASTGFVTVNVDYSLAKPGRRGYPEQVEEIQRAIRWNIAHARRFGGDPRMLGLLGFSAGGYLAAMGGLLDSRLPGRPVHAVVTLSAPLDLPALIRLLRARLKSCGFRTSCPEVPQAPRLSAFGTLFDFLGCPTGKCSTRRIRDASPSSHVGATSPAFLIFNSEDELVPRSQAADMGMLLRAARVPAQVVIVPGSRHGETYAPDVSPTILKFLGRQLGLPQLQLDVRSTPAASSGSQTLLVVCCALVAAVSLAVVLLAVRRRRTGHRPLEETHA